jgi:hypothetical protein
MVIERHLHLYRVSFCLYPFLRLRSLLFGCSGNQIPISKLRGYTTVAWASRFPALLTFEFHLHGAHGVKRGTVWHSGRQHLASSGMGYVRHLSFPVMYFLMRARTSPVDYGLLSDF